MAREHRERSSSSLTAIQSLLRLNLFTIGSFNELHFGPRRISLWVLPTQSTCGNHAGALCRATTGCEGEKITGVVYRPDPALTPAPPFLPPIANVFEPRPCSFFLQSKERNLPRPRLGAMILRNRRKSSMTKRRTNLDNLINGADRDCGTQRITRRGVSPQGRYIIILGQGTAHNTCTRIWPDCGLPGFVWRIRSGA